jgi:hypothetical protein
MRRKEKDFELCPFIAKETFTWNFTNHFHIFGEEKNQKGRGFFSSFL